MGEIVRLKHVFRGSPQMSSLNSFVLVLTVSAV